MSEALMILGKKIMPGEHAQFDVNIAFLHTHTPIAMPVFIQRGKKPGPVLLLVAGIHGDEFNGVEIVRRMIHHKLLAPERGTVIAIPVVNVFGFLEKSREFPGGKDLNRSFPGSKGGSLASRTAHFITEEILPIMDCGIDFHTGGSALANYPHVRVHFEHEKDLGLARAFNSKFVVRSGLLDKSLRKAAWSQKKQMLVFEGGKTLEYNETMIQDGINGTLSVMKHLGMKKTIPHIRKRKSIFLKNSKWIRAPLSGMMRVTVKNGTKVHEGDTVALISDPFGQTEKKVKSPSDGYVFCVNEATVVNQGDPLIHIGM